MYQFYYDEAKKKCKCVLLFTDTDSLCFETEEDFYEIMHQSKDLYHLSNSPKDSKCFYNDNKKVTGEMKDEYAGIVICKFMGLKSKTYSICDVHKNEKSVYKGQNSDIKYDEFIDTHSNKKVIRHNMSGITSINHILVTYESNKISLSAFDDRRYILDDEIKSLPYGHKDIMKN